MPAAGGSSLTAAIPTRASHRLRLARHTSTSWSPASAVAAGTGLPRSLRDCHELAVEYAPLRRRAAQPTNDRIVLALKAPLDRRVAIASLWAAAAVRRDAQSRLPSAEQRRWTDSRETGLVALVLQRIVPVGPVAGHKHLEDVHSERNIETSMSHLMVILTVPKT